MMQIDFDKDVFLERHKCIRHSKCFLSRAKYNASKSHDDLITQNTENLHSNDLKQICDSIIFFAENVDSINLEILNEIFNMDFKSNFDEYDCFEIYDCINKLVEEISKRSIFLENTDFAMIFVNFLIDFTNSDEKQFAITAYQSISNFIFANKDIASFLSKDFLNECLNRFLAFIEELKSLDNENWDEIDNTLHLIQSIIRIFCAMFFHQELITTEYSEMVVRCFHALLDIETSPDHEHKLKEFIVDNAYWFAMSASDESIQNLLSPKFIEIILYFLELQDFQGQDTQESIKYINTDKLSTFETIGNITEHDDQFSLFFLQPPIDLLNKMNDYNNWENETKHSFLKILSNFTACHDPTPSLNMIESSEMTEFLKSIFTDCSFNAQNEAFIVLFNMILSKNSSLIEYVLTNFSDIFQNSIEFLKADNLYFNTLCCYSIYICYKYLETQSDEMKNEFIGSIKNYEWVNLFEKFSLSSDEKLSGLGHILFDIIEKSD